MGDLLDAIDNMASSFWCMCDSPERELKPVPSKDAYNFPECDYDWSPTNLYTQIEAKNWTSVNHFLLTGYWSGSFFADSNPPAVQVCTWVTRFDQRSKRKKVIWTHLPIHAALSFGAPEGVVQLLVKLAPPTLRCADDQRMLPLHLAFRRGATDATISAIVDAFPEAVAVRDFLGRTPAECSAEGPNPKRGNIIQTVLYYNQKAWEKKAAKAQEKHIASIRETLKKRTQKVENFQVAYDLVLTRDEQTRRSFTMAMGELSKFKTWYDEAVPAEQLQDGNEGKMSAAFVKVLTNRLDTLFAMAEGLKSQQKKSKKCSDKQLSEMHAVWDVNGTADGMKLRSFGNALDQAEDEAEQKPAKSDVSSQTSLVTSSTTNKNKKQASKDVQAETERMLKNLEVLHNLRLEMAPSMKRAESKAEEAKRKVEHDEEPEEEIVKIDKAPVEVPKQAAPEKQVEKSVGGAPNVLLPVETVETPTHDSDIDIHPVISEMTSLDMSELESGASKASKASFKRKSFKMGIPKFNIKITKVSDIKSLPPKAPTSMIKQPKISVLSGKKGGSVSPAL